jgi:DNA-binding NtrC family response regulator
MDVQKTLLRFLQEREFLRLGDTVPRKVDVRILSATNTDLKACTRTGAFREDLYYRLNAVTVHLPPLRERPSDIPLLAAHFIRRQNAKFGTAVRGLSPDALAAAVAYPWPGNIRELKNAIDASLALEAGEVISRAVLSQFIETRPGAPAMTQRAPGDDGRDYAAAVDRFEEEYFRALLRTTKGNVEAAAAAAGINMATIYRKMKRYGIRREEGS